MPPSNELPTGAAERRGQRETVCADSAPQHTQLRRPRLPVAVAFLGAVAAYPLPFVFLVVIFEAPFDVLIRFGDSPYRNIVVGVAILLALITLILPYLVSRTVYRLLRWKIEIRPGRWCIACGYNLTGNESGTCPECGEPVVVTTASETAP